MMCGNHSSIRYNLMLQAVLEINVSRVLLIDLTTGTSFFIHLHMSRDGARGELAGAMPPPCALSFFY
jgi:hypothetical protein